MYNLQRQGSLFCPLIDPQCLEHWGLTALSIQVRNLLIKGWCHHCLHPSLSPYSVSILWADMEIAFHPRMNHPSGSNLRSGHTDGKNQVVSIQVCLILGFPCGSQQVCLIPWSGKSDKRWDLKSNKTLTTNCSLRHNHLTNGFLVLG